MFRTFTKNSIMSYTLGLTNNNSSFNPLTTGMTDSNKEQVKISQLELLYLCRRTTFSRRSAASVNQVTKETYYTMRLKTSLLSNASL